MPHHDNHDANRWSSGAKLAFAAFAIIAAFFLLVEHRAHVFPYLPYLLLAACPLMHLFMHRGHGSHGAGHGHGRTGEPEDGSERNVKPRPSDAPESTSSGPRHQHEEGS